MRVLLFGPDGQIGAAIRSADGLDIRGVGRGECDLTAPGAAAAIIADADCDAVINAAAYTAVDKAESEPNLAEAVNAVAPGEMARACAARGLAFVHYSTDYVFDGGADGAYVESDAPHPINVYGATKRRGEEAALAAGGACVIIRTSWVFSAHGANFVKTMLRLSESRDALRIVADQRGKPTPAAALAEAGLAAARALRGDPALAGLYHFAGDEATTWADFAAAIFERAGRRVAIERIATSDYPTPAARPANSVLDTAKFEKTFGLAAPSWRRGLDDVIGALGAAQTEKRA